MKKIKMISAGVLLAVIALVVVKYSLLSTAEDKTLPPAIVIEKDSEQPLGTSENPLTVLEIVPHESMAEFGYMISGCEPIDLDGLKTNQNMASQYISKVCQSGIATRAEDISYYKMPDEIEPGDTIGDVDTNKYNEDMAIDWTNGQLIMKREDYNIVTANYGVWNKASSWPAKTFSGYYEIVDDGEGWFNKIEENGAVKFKYVGRGNGNYRWVTAENTQNVATDYDANKVWTTRTPALYYEYKEYNFQHNNDLITTIFEGEDPSSIESQVIVMTPYEFTNPDNLELLEQADLIYLHRAHDSGGVFEMWVELNKEGETLKNKYGESITAAQAKSMTFDDNDLPWPAVMTLIERMSGENPAGLILDEAVYNTKSNKRNCHKLVLMIKQYGANVFKELYLDTGKVVESEPQDDMDGLTTGVFVKDEDTKVSDWTKDTFVPDPTMNTQQKYEYGMLNPDVNGQHPLTGESMWSEVRDNMYFYPGDKGFLDDFLNETLKETASNAEAFDYFEDKDSLRPTGLSAKDIIKYLLQNISKKRNLKILEVEPCDDFIYGSEGWEVYYLSMFSWFEGKLEKDVEIVTMTTAQFISSIEDLNSEYDAIVFGTKQNAGNGANGYNDTKLHGTDAWGNPSGWLAYTSIGDIVTKSAKQDTSGKKELVGNDALRYSGTDITAKKLEELKAYLNAGKPIVLDRSCTSRDTGKVTPNTKLIDKSSYMYQLVDMYNQKIEGVETENLFVKGLYQTNKLKRVLAYETCRIKFDTSGGGNGYPTEYSYTPDENDGTITNVTYSPSRTFEYSFKIVGKTGQKYSIALFIDMNGDGVYEGSLKETDHMDALNNGISEQVSGIVVKDRSGRIVSPNELYANVNYTLSKELEDTYQGILPWKLEACKADNENCRNSVVKYSAVKTSNGEKEEIKVLLMNLTPDMSDPVDFFANVGITTVSESKIIKMNKMEQFQKYLSCVDEYDVTLEYLENEQWLEKFNNSAMTQAEQISAWKQYLNGFDMLILGFNDDCVYTDNYVYNEGFKYFASQGKSIILSHDMVRDNSQLDVLQTAYDEQLRQMLGQRRYFTNTVMVNGQSLSLIGEKTAAYAETMSDGTVLPGVVDNATRLYTIFGDVGKSDRDAFARGKWGATQKGADGVTEYINVINQGQITNYPYKIDDVIEISTTHTQNFQLNMEDPDLVVWYGLTDQYSEKYGKRMQEKYGLPDYSTDTEKYGRGVYSSIEGDGRNSFYIYNKGNITYTGLGHTGKMTDEEVQLFVNTMISAYRATAATPKIKVTNEDAIYNGNEVTLYIPLDDANFNTDSEYLNVYFKVSDSSLIAVVDRTYVLEYADANGNTVSETTYLTSSNGVVPVNADGTVIVKKDGEYYFRVPYSKVRSDGVATYRLTLNSSYVNVDDVIITTEATTTVHVMPMPLFTLN